MKTQTNNSHPCQSGSKMSDKRDYTYFSFSSSGSDTIKLGRYKNDRQT